MEEKEAPGTAVEERKHEYEPPRILATYRKEELAELIRPHGPSPSYGGGCGCG